MPGGARRSGDSKPEGSSDTGIDEMLEWYEISLCK